MRLVLDLYYPDAGKWAENKHPRAKSGQHGGEFVKKGQEGAGKAPAKSKEPNARKQNGSKEPTPLYHVTLTKNVPSIRKHGLKRFRPSNFIKAGSRERYGSGEIYTFEHLDDALRWAGRMDWDLHQGTGTGKISIVTVKAPGHNWDVDENDPLSHAGAKGRWLKTEKPVPSEAIVETKPVDQNDLRELTARLYADYPKRE